ncbi:glutamine amidotransferase subunit PdxT [Anaerostipes sp. 494a]|uniref:pyridoxal 5'-phosphate synthase glutaminase subunit PdxT n=1 Tax=Anaerostipes TaxID=207244 RepID=UPI000951AD9A|nr:MULTISPECIES: pyridoxal 5'-phosphate synthase glutaminase subunit PdxT [Anaerostipes]MCI5623886.1 pyridoxal 5'-phosphate synthase glutaminase subunit PdxT [Anaerostipes sp.]MDY2725249.1 pyridoxal 5'-phosphate synthase glutaminase subunit PdxT [Anaerostipes faecalis]OLR59373.1 glutamine amidotransferase subunit PdxT [Anaerostipes sp. 494a]
MRIGVLALQGAFIEHEQMVEQLGAEAFEIRQKKDLETPMDGLIIPGGESTVIGKLLRELDLYDLIKEKIEEGLPVFGTCAGLLLLAKKIDNDSRMHLATMDIQAVRNAYGRQLGSFYTEASFGDSGEIPMTFIRAPYIEETGSDTKVLAEVDRHIVAAQQGNQLVTAFHPELSKDLTVHRYFLEMVENSVVNNIA